MLFVLCLLYKEIFSIQRNLCPFKYRFLDEKPILSSTHYYKSTRIHVSSVLHTCLTDTESGVMDTATLCIQSCCSQQVICTHIHKTRHTHTHAYIYTYIYMKVYLYQGQETWVYLGAGRGFHPGDCHRFVYLEIFFVWSFLFSSGQTTKTVISKLFHQG